MRASLRSGLGLMWKQRRVLALYYLSNLICAFILILPLAALVGSQLTHSLQAARMFDRLDPSFFAAAAFRYTGYPFTSVALIGSLLACVYLVFNTFFTGGVLATYHAGRGFGFFTGCARYFPRLFRLFLISLLFYVVLFAGHAGLQALVAKLFKDSMVAGPLIVTGWIVSALAFVLFLLLNMLFDYAKVKCVVDDSRRTWRETFRAMSFVFRHFRDAVGIYGTLTAAGFLMAFAYLALAGVIGQGSVIAVVALFLLRQIYTAARFALTLWFYSAELTYYSETRPQRIVATPSACLDGRELYLPVTTTSQEDNFAGSVGRHAASAAGHMDTSERP